MRVLLCLLLLAGAAGAQECPPPPDFTAQKAPLLEAARKAPDPASAQALMNELWKLWTQAPDARAQGLLDKGMERRAAWDLDGALAPLNELVGYCPDYAEGWNQRAFVHFLKSDFATALEDLERAIELAPDHIAARAGLALTLANLGRTKASQGVLREALEMNPWLPERAMLIAEPKPEGEEL